jgi:hypothetical protein
MATNETILSDLHGALAQELANRIRGVTIVDEEGQSKVVRASAAELSVAATFLKNNNVTSAPDEDGAVSELSKMMAAKRARRAPIMQDTLEAMPPGMH